MIIGGGNAKHIEVLPPHCRRRDNKNALLGAERLWEGTDMIARPVGTTWRVILNETPPPQKMPGPRLNERRAGEARPNRRQD